LSHLSPYEPFPGIGSGIAKCPFDPDDNATAVWIGNDHADVNDARDALFYDVPSYSLLFLLRVRASDGRDLSEREKEKKKKERKGLPVPRFAIQQGNTMLSDT
jgi:hypothetical protein